MAYMFSDTTPKVGFRPYGRTNPFGAAHLSGVGEEGRKRQLGVYYPNRPFDPWELYPDVHETGGPAGLGQNHPFDPRAWHLHGLGQDQTAQDAIDYSDPTSGAVFTSPAGAPVPDATAQAVAELEANGTITSGEGDAILNGSMTFDDVLGYDPTDSSGWHGVVGLFQEVNQDLQSLEAEAQQDPAVAAAIGPMLIQARNQYSSLASEFVRYYTLLFGSTPAGLSGLGIAPLVVAAGFAAFLVACYVTLQAIQAKLASIDVEKLKTQVQQQAIQLQQQTQQNIAQLVQLQQQAQARGDTIAARTYGTQIAQLTATGTAQAAGPTQPSPSQGAGDWLMANWKPLAFAAVGLIVVGNLLPHKR